MYKRITLCAMLVLVGVPTVVFGSSVGSSLIAGKTPSEAVAMLSQDINVLTGKVDTLQNQQKNASARIDHLEKENASLKAKLNATSTPTPPVVATADGDASKIKELQTKVEVLAVKQEKTTAEHKKCLDDKQDLIKRRKEMLSLRDQMMTEVEQAKKEFARKEGVDINNFKTGHNPKYGGVPEEIGFERDFRPIEDKIIAKYPKIDNELNPTGWEGITSPIDPHMCD